MWIVAIIFVAGAWYSYGKSRSVWKALRGGLTALLIYFSVIAIFAVIGILTGAFSVALGATSPIAVEPVSTRTSGLSAIAEASKHSSQQSTGVGLGSSQQISITVGTLVPMNEDARPTPTPGRLFTSVPPVPTRPSSEVVELANGYEWVEYSSGGVRFNYPNGWNTSIERDREDGTEIGSIGIAHEDQRFDVTWYLLEYDLLWMFENRGRYRDLTNETTQLFEESYIDLYPRSWIAENISVDRRYIGKWPTFSTYGHNLVIDGNWTDADKLATIGGVVICGPNRVCVVQYGKVDRPYSLSDWDLLDTFMQSLSFVRDDPLPRYVLTRVPIATSTPTPSPTPMPTATPTPTNTPVAAPTVAASIDPESNEWIPYRSEVVAFDAMIPPAFDIEEVPDDDGNPGGSVYLSSDPERSQGLYVLIGVFAIPIAEETKGEPISQFSLGFNVKEDLIDQGATIISGPQLIEIAGAPGVHFIVDLPQDASGIDARSYKATISNGTWLHNIEVIGPIEDEETIQAYYESFIASFVPHDSSTVPLATPGRPPRPPRR